MQRYELFLKPPNISLIIYRHLMSTSCRHRNEIHMFKLRINGYYDGEEHLHGNQFLPYCMKSLFDFPNPIFAWNLDAINILV